jgi:hypothetical protein
MGQHQKFINELKKLAAELHGDRRIHERQGAPPDFPIKVSFVFGQGDGKQTVDVETRMKLGSSATEFVDEVSRLAQWAWDQVKDDAPAFCRVQKSDFVALNLYRNVLIPLGRPAINYETLKEIRSFYRRRELDFPDELRARLRMSHVGDWGSIAPTWAGCGSRSTERGRPPLSGSATQLI